MFQSNSEETRKKKARVLAENPRVAFRMYYLLNKLDEAQHKKSIGSVNENAALDTQIVLIQQKLLSGKFKYLLAAYGKASGMESTRSFFAGMHHVDLVNELVNNVQARILVMTELYQRFYQPHSEESISNGKAKLINAFTKRFNKINKYYRLMRFDQARYDELSKLIAKCEGVIIKQKEMQGGRKPNNTDSLDATAEIKKQEKLIRKAKAEQNKLQQKYEFHNRYKKFQSIYKSLHASEKEVLEQQQLVDLMVRDLMKAGNNPTLKKSNKILAKNHKEAERKLEKLQKAFAKRAKQVPTLESKYLRAMQTGGFFGARIPVDHQLVNNLREQAKSYDEQIAIANQKIQDFTNKLTGEPQQRQPYEELIKQWETFRAESLDYKYKLFDNFFGEMAADLDRRWNPAGADAVVIRKMNNPALGVNRKHFKLCTSAQAESLLLADNLGFIIHPSMRNDGTWRLSFLADDGIRHLPISADAVQRIANSKSGLTEAFVDEILNSHNISLRFVRIPAPVANPVRLAIPPLPPLPLLSENSRVSLSDTVDNSSLASTTDSSAMRDSSASSSPAEGVYDDAPDLDVDDSDADKHGTDYQPMSPPPHSAERERIPAHSQNRALAQNGSPASPRAGARVHYAELRLSSDRARQSNQAPGQPPADAQRLTRTAASDPARGKPPAAAGDTTNTPAGPRHLRRGSG